MLSRYYHVTMVILVFDHHYVCFYLIIFSYLIFEIYCTICIYIYRCTLVMSSLYVDHSMSCVLCSFRIDLRL